MFGSKVYMRTFFWLEVIAMMYQVKIELVL